MFFKHPFFSTVMFLSLSATYSNANHNRSNDPYLVRPQYPTANLPSTATSEVSIPQLPPSNFILMHDAKKILNFVVRSLDDGRAEEQVPRTTSAYEYKYYEAAAEPTAVSDLRRAVHSVEKSALTEEDWGRIQRLIKSIIDEYGHPEPEAAEKPATPVEEPTAEIEEEVFEDVLQKRTPGQVMATYMAGTFVAYHAFSLLFL